MTEIDLLKQELTNQEASAQDRARELSDEKILSKRLQKDVAVLIGTIETITKEINEEKVKQVEEKEQLAILVYLMSHKLKYKYIYFSW